MPTDMPISGYPNNLRALTVTIASGAAASEIFATQGDALVGLEMPAAWTAADVAYKTCLSGNVGKLKQVYNAAGLPVSTVAVAAVNIAIPQGDTIFTSYMQLLSVSTADDTTGVNQGADRTLTLLFRRYLS